MLGASTWVGAGADFVPAPASQRGASSWPADERKKASDQLLDYFGKTAPQLLRPAEGLLTHPGIACSLPGKQYSTNLWDWDTYWTARGLFRLAANGSLNEYYHPDTRAALSHKGFMDWNLLVLEMM